MIRFFFWANLLGCAWNAYFVLYGTQPWLSLLLIVLSAFVAGRLSAAIDLEALK